MIETVATKENRYKMGLDARIPVFGGLRTTKAQTSLRIPEDSFSRDEAQIESCPTICIMRNFSIHIYTIRLGLTFLYLKGAQEPVHEISNNVVCATSKASDQPAHTRSLIRAFACRLNIL